MRDNTQLGELLTRANFDSDSIDANLSALKKDDNHLYYLYEMVDALNYLIEKDLCKKNTKNAVNQLIKLSGREASGFIGVLRCLRENEKIERKVLNENKEELTRKTIEQYFNELINKKEEILKGDQTYARIQGLTLTLNWLKIYPALYIDKNISALIEHITYAYFIGLVICQLAEMNLELVNQKNLDLLFECHEVVHLIENRLSSLKHHNNSVCSRQFDEICKNVYKEKEREIGNEVLYTHFSIFSPPPPITTKSSSSHELERNENIIPLILDYASRF
jgi:hypothetical protein